MDVILFMALWLGGALLHTLIELKFKNHNEADSRVVVIEEPRKQRVTIKKGVNNYE